MHIPRNKFVRVVWARPRLFIAAAAAMLVGWGLPDSLVHQSVTRVLVAWNFGPCLYLVLAAVMMVRSSHHKMRLRAPCQDEGQYVVLVLVVVSTVASLAAIAGELAVVKDLHGF